MSSPLRARFTWRCLDLEERVAWIRAVGCGEPSRQERLAVRRRLRALAPPSASNEWRGWLRYKQVAAAEFERAALDRAPSEVSPLPTQEWERVLADIMQADVEGMPEHARAVGRDLPILCRLLDPFLHWVWTDLRGVVAEARRHGVVCQPDAVGHSQLTHVLRAIWPAAQRAFVLEVNRARVSGRLKSGDPAARLQEFTDRFRGSGRRLRALHGRYPALARLLTTACMNSAREIREVIGRYAADAAAIASELFDGADPGPIAQFSDITGDPHEGGRRVRVLTFTNGTHLVYKPRALDGEAAFQRFVAWLNRAGLASQLPTLRLLSRPTHGWCGFVSPASMSDDDAVRRYYRRMGAWLPVLWIVQGTDFHCENVIASGEYPTPIDLELLFTNHTSVLRRGRESAAQRFLRLSVIESGMLPATPIRYEDSAESGEMSALGKREGQVWNERVERIEGADSDEIRVSRGRQQLPFTPNLPRLNGTAVDFAEYQGDVLDGVRAAFDLICARNDALLADPPAVADLFRWDTRVVIRPTVDYARMLWRSYHPDYLRDALSREFSLVAQLRPGLHGRAEGDAVVDIECADLKDGDIPRFKGLPTSCEVSGRETLVRLFRRPAAETARDRIRTLTTTVVRHQHRIAQLALSSHGTRLSADDTLTGNSVHEVPTPAALLDEALAIGRQIRDEAFRTRNSIDWFGLRSFAEGSALGTMGPDFYEGAAGIAVFLTQLSRRWSGDGFETLALRAAIGAGRSTFRRRHPGGAFSGDASICYALLHVGGTLGDAGLTQTGLKLLLEAGRTRRREHGCDLISGAAGLIAVLLTAHQITGSAAALDLAQDLGDALIEERIETASGWGWPNEIKSTAPLTGCAHGAAGIAWALGRLAVATGEGRFDAAARRALDYERAAYDPGRGGWPDLRTEGVTGHVARQTSIGWCYGPAGVVLARLAARPAFDSDDLTEITALLRRIEATPIQSNDSVCHGESGLVEALIAASSRLSDASWLDVARRRLATALHRRRGRGGWRGGIPRQEATPDPGFMLGRSGIGYELLRAADPDVPSVLALEGPAAVANAAPRRTWIPPTTGTDGERAARTCRQS